MNPLLLVSPSPPPKPEQDPPSSSFPFSLASDLPACPLFFFFFEFFPPFFFCDRFSLNSGTRFRMHLFFFSGLPFFFFFFLFPDKFGILGDFPPFFLLSPLDRHNEVAAPLFSPSFFFLFWRTLSFTTGIVATGALALFFSPPFVDGLL